jgi:hypothetical protein
VKKTWELWLTYDEKWVYHYVPPTKQESMQ